jgi:hypothetical protein
MIKQKFYERVTNSKKDLIYEFLQVLSKEQVLYCIIGGIAVNAYCEPLITLDFDCIIPIEEMNRIKEKLKKMGFKIKTHPYTWEITHKDSDVRIQIQRDKRYQEFIKKAELRSVLGYPMMVAQKEDVLKGKVWAYDDITRDELKRDKDLLDIKRLVQKYPGLKKLLTKEMREKLKIKIR